MTNKKMEFEPAAVYDDGQRINTIGTWLKREFGHKVVKLALDGGFTCPNRDGSKGTGGCLFCSESGSGEHASRINDPLRLPGTGEKTQISRAVDEQISLLSSKWPDSSYIAYFQSFSNTYAPAERLKALFESALKQPGIVGLAIATRPDCLQDDVLELLEDLNRSTFLWVELGLQTIHPVTMKKMNLCYTLEDYDNAITKLRRRNIRIVTHLLMGLPGETRDMMMDSVKYVCRPVSNEFLYGIKLHMLNLVKNTKLAELHPDYVPFRTVDEYVDLVIDAIELIPRDITVHRIYAEAPKGMLISPPWARQKRKALNAIAHRMKERNTWQGRCAENYPLDLR